MTDPSPGLQLGVVLPPCPSPDELRAAAAYADDSGLHSLWVTDRTVAGMPWLDGPTVLSALTLATRRIQIGTSVLVLPRRNPVHTAHALATVDHLSGGRLIAGIGVGNAAVSAQEFEIAGADMAQRGRLTDEYLDLVRRLWTEDTVEHEGNGWRCSGITLSPKPARPVPVWVGGATPAARERAARTGDGWLAVFSTPERFAGEWEEVQQAATRHGRDSRAITPAAYVFGAIDEDGVSSRQLLEAVLPGFLGMPFEAIAKTCLFGTPEEWLEQLSEWESAGARHVNVALFSGDLVKDLHLLGERVVPQLARPVAAVR